MDTLIFITVGLIALVVIYHWIDLDNFYGGVVESKETGIIALTATKEIGGIAVNGFRASKRVYQANKSDHELIYAKAGLNYEEEKFSKRKANIKGTKEIFAPIKASLKEVEVEAAERYDANIVELDRLAKLVETK